jgi:MscS family membrane protein
MGEFFEKTFYGNTVQEWAIALLIIVGGVIVAKVFYWILKNFVGALTKKTKTRLDDIITDMVEEPVVLAIVLGGIWYAFSRLEFSDLVREWIGHAFQFVVTLNIAWMITRLFDALYKEYLVPLAEKSETDLDDQLLPIVRKGTKLIVWSLAVIVALDNAGYNVGAALAGLGIGGIALAMASKDTVPNAKFADSAVENVSMEPGRKVVSTIGLTYDMKPDQMRKALEILREIADANEGVDNEKTLVAFSGFGDFSMNILFIYWIVKDADILDTQTAVNLAILDRFLEDGLDMAFPTQTVYTKAA